MNKLIIFLFFILMSCEKALYNSKEGVANEKYRYYNKNFTLPEQSSLKTKGVYICVSNELFDYKVESYKNNYLERTHPALKGNIPSKDTVIAFKRYFYCQFENNGKWKQSGGFYSLADLIKEVKKMDKEQNYDIYKIENDSVFLESYNWYRKRFTYRNGVVVSDTIFLKDQKSSKNSNTVKYVYYPIEL
ncbi:MULTISPECIES: hypothetical protein [Flavobacterium]|uniref:Lipoprotein n=1 Tax=Flavobacterium jumunjinense TaxID=998845 RepID=A0ABV5GL79_9FLAO|nr:MULTISPECIES: hypothetical protein [Flavobacterium]